MGEAIFKVLIPALVGLICGAIGSLIAPWVRWGIEKKREKLNYRKQIIKECREVFNKQEFDKNIFRETSCYSCMRPHLSKNLIDEIESETIYVQTEGRGTGVDNFRSRILDEVAQFERTWDLV